MRNLWKCAFVLSLIGMGLAMSVPVQAASANGPYYATPSWDQKLDANTRFIVLLNWNSEAVLDRETGLVWERVPSTFASNWFNSSFNCLNLNAGGRTGWRLPTIQELLSLVDRSVVGPALPSGHPFTVLSGVYWSATTDASSGTSALDVLFGNGRVFSHPKSTTESLAWCVRGGQGVDPQ